MTPFHRLICRIASIAVLAGAAWAGEEPAEEDSGRFQNLLAFPTNFNPQPLPSPVPAMTRKAAPAALPTDDPRVKTAFAALQAGEVDEAVRLFKEVLIDVPGEKQVRFGLGTAFIKMDAYADAIEVLTGLMDDFPDDYFIKNNLAWVYATAKDASFRDGARCVELAQDALLIVPGDYHVWSTLAEGYYILGQYERALRAAAQAYTLGEQRKATPRNMLEYRNQILKCRRAAEAMSLIE